MTDNRSLVMGTLATDAFTVVNKRMLRYFEGDGTLAILACELISIYKYMLARNSVDELDSFPLPITFLQKTMNLSEFKQKRVLNDLQAKGIVTVTRVGMPASRRVALNFDAIARILDEEVEKENKQKEKSNKFYEELNAVSNKDNLIPPEFFKKLNNIRDPLATSMCMITWYVHSLHGKSIEWTPNTLGTVKTIVKYYSKNEAFDFGRIKDLLNNRPVNDFSSFISDIFKDYKSIAERTPSEREYDGCRLLTI